MKKMSNYDFLLNEVLSEGDKWTYRLVKKDSKNKDDYNKMISIYTDNGYNTFEEIYIFDKDGNFIKSYDSKEKFDNEISKDWEVKY